MRYFHANTNMPLRFSACGNLISKDGFMHQSRCFSTQVLILVLEGTLYISQGGQCFAVKPNQFIFLPANEEHFGTAPSRGRLSYLWAHFTVDEPFAEVGRPEMSSSGYFIPEHGALSHTQSSQRIFQLFHQLLDLSRQDNIYNSYMTDYAVSLLAMAIGQDFAQSAEHKKSEINSTVFKVTEWVRSNAHRHIGIADISEHFGYNVAYLSALFKRSTGYSLNQYLTKARIELAKNLLESNDVSVKEAAFSCGFYDEKYFMKVFKKQEGITPTDYKRRCR